MQYSIGDQPVPWIRPIWETLFDGLRRLAEKLENLFTTLESQTATSLLSLEQLVDNQVKSLIGDAVVAHAIRILLASAPVKEAAESLVAQRPDSRLQKSDALVRVQLLGGTIEKFEVPYYLVRPPKGPGRPKAGRSKSGNGFYPTLELLGIHGRATPAVASLVASQLARAPVDEATAVLAEQGLKLDSKTVTRIGMQLARRALEFEDHLLERLDKKVKGKACSGKRLGVAIDGGRLRTRETYGRRGRKTKRQKFKGVWREPKVFVIYELDDRGRRNKKGLYVYGGTMGGADECFRLLAAYLSFLGAHLAKEVIVLGDGAEWIWNRVDDLLKVTGVERSRVTELVDYYHAVERLHDEARGRCDWTENQRHPWVRARIQELQTGQLERLQQECETVRTGSSHYFGNNSTRLDYRGCRRRRLPLGSGAVESGIRRIVNLRLKGNGIFWGIPNAHGLMHLRCQLVAGRWKELIKVVTLPRELWGQYAA